MSELDWRKARLARQAARREEFSKNLRGAVNTKQGSSWDSRIQKRPKLTVHNASQKAIEVVRELMNNIQLPGGLKLTYAGLRRTARGMDQTELTDGVVTVAGQYRTTTGNNIYFDVPVEIHSGELLEPSVFIHDGSIKILAQSSFGEMSKDHTAYQDRPARDIYAPPFTKEEQQYSKPLRLPRRHPGIFESQASKQMLKRAIKVRGRDVEVVEKAATAPDWVKKIHDKGEGKSELETKEAFQPKVPDAKPIDPLTNLYDKTTKGPATPIKRCLCCDEPIEPGLLKPGLCEVCQDHRPSKGRWRGSSVASHEAFIWKAPGGEHIDPFANKFKDDFLDPAERDRSKYFKPGMMVSVQKNLAAMDRGGVRQHIPKGEKGKVLRDMAGDGKDLYILFENGLKAVVQQHFLKGASGRSRAAQFRGFPEDEPGWDPKTHCSGCLASFGVRGEGPGPEDMQEAEFFELDGKIYCDYCLGEFMTRKPSEVRGEPIRVYPSEPGTNKSADLGEKDIISQIRQEIASLKESGMAPTDIDIAIHRRYPAQAEQVLNKAAQDRFRGPDQLPGRVERHLERAEESSYQAAEEAFTQHCLEEGITEVVGDPKFDQFKEGWIRDWVDDYMASYDEPEGYEDRDY